MDTSTFELIIIATLVICIVGIIIAICKCRKALFFFIPAFILVATVTLTNAGQPDFTEMPANIVYPTVGTSKDLESIFYFSKK